MQQQTKKVPGSTQFIKTETNVSRSEDAQSHDSQSRPKDFSFNSSMQRPDLAKRKNLETHPSDQASPSSKVTSSLYSAPGNSQMSGGKNERSEQR